MKNNFNEAAQSLRGKTVVFAGELSAVNRRQASAIARELGATVTSEVSDKTDFVVAGTDAGTKLQQASERSIQILSEDDFFALIKEQRKAERSLNGPQ